MRLGNPTARVVFSHPQPARPRPFSLAQMALAMGIAALTFVLAMAASSQTGFNPDESRWLSRAHYLADLTDPFGPTWDDQYTTRGQPPLGSYVLGIGLLLQGRDLRTNPPWDFSRTWEANFALGNAPDPADLTAGRHISAALVALTTLILIATARELVSPPWALTAGAIFAVHPFTAYIGSLAMADALFGALIAAAGLAAAALGRRPTVTRAAALGALLGLGGATKLSPLVVAVGLGAAAVAVTIVITVRDRQPPRQAGFFVALSLVATVTAFATFIAVYPYLWPDPIVRTWNLFAFRSQEMATQAADWPVMDVPTRAEALRRAWANFSDRYSLTAWVASLLDRSVPLPVRQVEPGLAVLGLAVMCAAAARAGPRSPQCFVLAVLGGQVVVTMLGMRSEFDRYHLPMALLGAISAAVGLQWLVAFAGALWASPVRWTGRQRRLTKETICGS